jgi:serine phosphatase RsbU (regulator of sigma subunit)
VGGDYYDYVELPDGSTAILVADVAGKGVAAAMVMARVSAEAKFCLATETGPGVAMNKLNDRLCRLQLERFVTMVMLVLDPRTHRVTIVNAGHMPPLRRHADGTVEDLGTASSGMPLGIVPGNQYGETTISLAPGESLTMYTDGVQDAENEEGERYEVDRILGHVRDRGSCVRTLGRTLIDDVQRFMGDRPQVDDICLVCLGRIGVTGV